MKTIQNYENEDPLLERQGSRVSYMRIGPTEKMFYPKGMPTENIFVDHAGSKNTEPRPALEECLKFLQAEDILFVKSMDRLGRNLRELLDVVKRIANIGTAIIFVDEGLRLDPRAPDFDANFRWLKSMYRFERALINERRNEGLLEAKKNGVRLGRPTKVTDDQRQEIRERFSKGDTASSLAQEYGISASLVYTIGRNG
ncbi:MULTISPECIES: recombinase family protein [unclassified Pseudodesulfovibrio]|uniref:recombinase family protein n=1 Tax=unclassified Pseudodesulfovibrio TaxID=2661612 RepID=UPI000FEB7E82|nr:MULTISPECIES: recombinase family protein [unclassified Pseudodesulfovibrio]MCJ2163453.1 recombinase family protein [Pseudodesulfovibrio sp. S3-i]RWU06689.1 recombinase family protein [Pseudodesulfovibrio sp. S3]